MLTISNCYSNKNNCFFTLYTFRIDRDVSPLALRSYSLSECSNLSCRFRAKFHAKCTYSISEKKRKYVIIFWHIFWHKRTAASREPLKIATLQRFNYSVRERIRTYNETRSNPLFLVAMPNSVPNVMPIMSG